MASIKKACELAEKTFEKILKIVKPGMTEKELATEMLEAAGFSQVDIKEQEHDPINYYYIVRKL